MPLYYLKLHCTPLPYKHLFFWSVNKFLLLKSECTEYSGHTQDISKRPKPRQSSKTMSKGRTQNMRSRHFSLTQSNRLQNLRPKVREQRKDTPVSMYLDAPENSLRVLNLAFKNSFVSSYPNIIYRACNGNFLEFCRETCASCFLYQPFYCRF